MEVLLIELSENQAQMQLQYKCKWILILSLWCSSGSKNTRIQWIWKCLCFLQSYWSEFRQSEKYKRMKLTGYISKIILKILPTNKLYTYTQTLTFMHGICLSPKNQQVAKYVKFILVLFVLIGTEMKTPLFKKITVILLYLMRTFKYEKR